ncbi:Hint domain-containing protein [Gymnodinialimonas sp.]
MQPHSTLVRPLEVPPASPADETETPPAIVAARHSFAAPTLIQTPGGKQRLDTLEVGQHVLTRASAFAQITGIDHTRFTKRDLQDNPDFAPIRFDAGALPGVPEDGAALVSPDCLINWAEDPDGIDRFAANSFCDGGLIRRVIPEDGIHYIRLHFEGPQQLCIGGIWVELGPDTCPALDMPRRAPKLVQEIRIFRPLRH